VIKALENQVDAPDNELVIVDDGSTDGTKEWLENYDFVGKVRVVNQKNKGPASARNRGIELATGKKMAFLGDDTIPAEGWLAAHHRTHSSRENPDNLVVIGYTTWHPRIRITRFLRYINERGLQFGYSLIENSQDVPFHFFYTSNMSLASNLLEGERFNERFTHACWEDIELGYRLKQKGMQMVYEKTAVVHHDHSTNIQRFAKRQELVGYSAVKLYELYPEIDFLGLSSEGPMPLSSPFLHQIQKFIILLFQYFPVSFPKLWEKVMRHHYLKGLHRGWNDSVH
jgi:glycosyltransferase involved in cell wall biosynthesis